MDDDLKEKIEDGTIIFSRNAVVIGFSRIQQVDECIFLQKGFGNLSDPIKNEKMRKGISVKCEYLTAKNNLDWFLYDDEPPLPLLMNRLWDDTLPAMLPINDYLEQRAKGTPIVVVTPDELAKKITEQMFPFWFVKDDRRPSIPKPSWIRKALDGLTELKWASKQGAGRYSIPLSERRTPYKQFKKFEAAKRKYKEEKSLEEKMRLPLLQNVYE